MTITFNGNVGKDSVLRSVNIGDQKTSVLDVWVAENIKKRDGSKKVLWHKVVLWRKYAETMAQYLKSGRKVLVENGTGEAKAYTTKDGRIVPYIQVEGAKIQLLDSRVTEAAPADDAEDVEEVDELPFEL